MMKNISSVSDLRFKTKKVLANATNEPVFLFNRSTPTSVILSYENYLDLMDKLEDYFLAAKAEEYEKEEKGDVKWVSHAELQNLLSSKKR